MLEYGAEALYYCDDRALQSHCMSENLYHWTIHSYIGLPM